MSGLNSIMSGIGNSLMTKLIIIGILVLTLLILPVLALTGESAGAHASIRVCR